MTSRDRILAAFNHEKTDRIPVDFSGHRSSGIAALAYNRLRRYLRLDPVTPRVYDIVQQLAIVDDDILEVFDVDTIELGRGFLHDDKDWKDWILPDGTPCLIPNYISVRKLGEDWVIFSDEGQELGRQKKGCLYFEQSFFPMSGSTIIDDDFSNLEHILPRTLWTAAVHPGAHIDLDEAGLKELASGAQALRSASDRAIIGIFGGNMFEVPQMLYGMENYLMFLKIFPEAVFRLSEKLCGIYLKQLELWLHAVGPHIDIILFGDDLGGQSGPLISPEMYRRFFKPFHALLWRRAKQLADVKVMLHSCGSIRELLPDLIEAGLDAINPVQISARGMDAEELKKEYGRNIVFWGGACDTQVILPKASPESIKKHVTEQISFLHKDGGFVFQQVHNILADVPPENIVAMFNSFLNSGVSNRS
ncbi:MAG: methyltransferase [Candidatus Aminicenantes bacterium]|nr:methyltransferase [Candidatus Aminicenantes bacterium]